MNQELYKDVAEKLEQGVQKVMDSDEYKNWLTFCSKFHNYSLNNQILIYMQKPDASFVAGFTKWKQLGRNVNKGEKGIMIISPTPYKKQIEVEKIIDGESVKSTEEHTFLNFKKAYVFDLSQTSGKEIPNIRPTLLTDKVNDYEKLKTAITNISQVPISYDNLNGPNGYYSPSTDEIKIQKDLPETQTLKTMIHEIAHSVVDDPNSELSKVDRNTKEVRAESIAFIVCDRLGLDTADYTFKYVAGWAHGNDTKTLKENMEVIKSVSDELINKIESEIEKYNSHEQTQQNEIELADYITIQEMNEYGYQSNDMLPLTKERAEFLYQEGGTIYKLYPNNTKAEAADLDDIQEFNKYNPGCLFGIEKDNYKILTYGLDYKLNNINIEQKQNQKEFELEK